MAELPGTTATTEPVTAVNLPFQPRIAYRTGDYSTVRHALLERLAETFPGWNPELAARDGARDMGVALVELFAYMADILGFYQDCRANEAYLRTAVLPGSLIELCALIDYRRAPGASAGALEAFLLKEGQRGVIPAGFRVKSQAVGGAPSLMYETARELEGDAARNRLKLLGHDRSLRTLSPPGAPATTDVLLDQGYSGLKAGAFVVLSAEGGSEIAVRLGAVTLEGEKRRIGWAPGAVPAGADLPIADLTVYGAPKQAMVLAARARADEITAGALAAQIEGPGASAIGEGDRVLFVSGGLMEPALVIGRSGDVVTWNRGFTTSLLRSETRIYRGATAGHTDLVVRRGAMSIPRSLIAGEDPEPGDHLLISDASGVERVTVARTDGYTIHLAEPAPRAFHPVEQMHSHATVELHRVRLPREGVTTGISTYAIPSPARLTGAEQTLTLDRTYEGLEAGALLVLHDGTHTAVNRVESVEVDADGRTVLHLEAPAGAAFEIASFVVYGPFAQAMRVDGYDRSEATLAAGQTRLTFAGAVEGLRPGDWLAIEGGGRAEGVRITAISTDADGHTVVDLEHALVHAYPLADAVVYGNVVPITHGETVVEQALGSGDRSLAGQRFTLHRQPTSYIHDATAARGVASTLEVFVNDARWTAVESLAESGPEDRHYSIEVDEAGVTSFTFGDGRHGARLPTGRDNVRVRYRVGLGADGNVAPGTIRTMPRPLPFIESAFNPAGAAGGADPETVDEMRRIAPVTIRTLDRAVSLADYADLALSYAGIAKARADWDREDGRRIVRLTVAAVGGQPMTAPLKDALRAYLDARRSPHHRLRIRDYQRLPIRLELDVHVLPDHLRLETKVRVERALGAGYTGEDGASGEPGYFRFERRDFGGALYLSDIYGLVERVQGVDHVLATAFHPESAEPPAEQVMDRIEIPPDALATGGHPSDPAVGILVVRVTGGLA
ncbi:MAG TPA: putative baseplate assembly protein [Longimicrobiales bacterium]